MISLTNSGVPFIPIADDTLKSGYGRTATGQV